MYLVYILYKCVRVYILNISTIFQWFLWPPPLWCNLVFTRSRWGQLGKYRSPACSFFPYTSLTVCLLHRHLLSQISSMSSPFASLSFIFESRIKLAEQVDSAVKCDWLIALGLASPWTEFGKSKHKIVQGALSFS